MSIYQIIILMIAFLLLIGLGIFIYYYIKNKDKPKDETKDETIKIEKDIKYATENKFQVMDVYTPIKLKHKNPIIIIHGGGWVKGDKLADREVSFAKKLADHGFFVFSLNYTIGEKSYPQNMKDVNKAIEYITEKYKNKLDMNNIILLGASAGAMLAGLIAVQPNNKNIKSVIYFYGISDPLERVYSEDQTTKDGKKKEEGEFRTGHMLESLGIKKCISCKDSNALPRNDKWCKDDGKLHCVSKLWKEVSIIENLKNNRLEHIPKFIMFHGKNDKIVNVEQTESLNKTLIELKQSPYVLLIENGRHGFNFQNNGDGTQLSTTNLNEIILDQL